MRAEPRWSSTNESGDNSLRRPHLGRNVDDPLVEEEAHVPVEKVGDVLQDRLVPTGGCLLQQERSQTRHGLPAKETTMTSSEVEKSALFRFLHECRATLELQD